METVKQWYIVYTKPEREHKVCESLRRKKLDSFYLANKLTKTSYGKERVAHKILLERFVFVALSEDELNIIRNIDNITNFVHWLAKPVILSADDIYLLRRFFDMHDGIRLEKRKVNLAEPASISSSFSDKDRDTIHFNFPALGYVMIAEESKTTVKVITVSNNTTKTIFKNKYAEAR